MSLRHRQPECEIEVPEPRSLLTILYTPEEVAAALRRSAAFEHRAALGAGVRAAKALDRLVALNRHDQKTDG